MADTPPPWATAVYAHTHPDPLAAGGGQPARWWDACRQMWAALPEGRPVGPYMQIRRPLLRRTVGSARDMRADLAALRQVPEVGPAVQAATAADPDWRWLAGYADVADGGADPSGGRVWLAVAGAQRWPAPLDASSPALVGRFVTFEVAHAGWRDRRSRRLVAVAVDAIEWWPPTSC